MPCQLLRDGQIVSDDWRYWEEGASHAGALILRFEQWLQERDAWIARGGRLGVVLSPAHRVPQLLPDLSHFALIAADFTGPSEGRGYSQGRLLRENWKFTGELRATGYVRQDQVFFMARCGFNSFELPAGELAAARAAFNTFSAAYQPSNDAGLRVKLARHEAPRQRRDTPANGGNGDSLAAPP